MKIYKLYTHQKAYNDADLLINSKEHPDVKINDIVEVYHKDDEENTRLLLQVKKFKDLKNRDAISIESGVATQFKLRPFTDVVMHVINVADVALDSMEIIFKDQYMGRSEMWRLKQYLLNNCVYVNKKIEYCDIQMRCQVYELWCQGERVSCGVITEDTKIIFRSSTSMVYLFLQMSSEMWDYDIHGDLYFEKSVNGFLTELFNKWKKFACNHEVTIVLFSRTFYEATTLEEFPEHMRDCLQQDYKGRFYEDFYRVAMQNERNDDWCTVLGQLRKLFTTYQSVVLNYHSKGNIPIPTPYNSTASQGNFLEVLNISLNKFEKHYLDRAFDRTGQLSVVVTPGVGVFEVDRELTNITKQRIIDNGVGSDLVCVGEQPLHAVPLLKFHNKDTALTSVDDYSLPHWINLSFYSTNKKIAYSNFIPRIKIPLTIANSSFVNDNGSDNSVLNCSQSYIHNSFFDYEAYDDQIFQPLPAQGTCTLQRIVKAKKTSVPSLETYDYCNDWDNFISTNLSNLRRKLSDPNIHHGTAGISSKMAATTISSEYLAFEKNARRSIVSIVPIVRPGRALINPFDPTHVTVKLTSNRRRWTHIFPKGPTGVLIQQHHYQAVPIKNNNPGICVNDCEDCDHISVCSINTKSSLSYDSDSATTKDSKNIRNSRGFNTSANEKVTPTKSFLWGATGEQEWTPAITTDKVENYIRKNLNPIFESKSTSSTAGEYNVETYGTAKVIIGVDWKSLTIPACLPITTDYFPDKRSLHNDYVVSDYTLLPDDVNMDFGNNRNAYVRKQWSTEEVFLEIVSQRLAQGFQLIILEEKPLNPTSSSSSASSGTALAATNKNFGHSTSVFNIRTTQENSTEYTLSIGRIFHRISLNGSVIKVTGYRPRHPYPPINVDYRYRFHAPQHETYAISGVNFMTEKLENFNWNYMDHYICTRGDMEYPLLENLKYWRYRMYLLPKDNKSMNKILDIGSQYCDIFTDITIDLFKQQIDDFMRFMELHINKLKRCKPRDSPTAQSHLTRRRHSTSIISRPPSNNQGFANSPFRERVGSNRLPEKRPSCGTPRSTIAKMERITRLSQTSGDTPPQTAGGGGGQIGEIAIRDDCFDGFTNEMKLHSNAGINEILEAMQHPNTGMSFITQTPSLPLYTFVSYDALIWLKNHLTDDRNPLHILEDMRRDKMICHASGDWNKTIIPGFYLYYIVQKETDADGNLVEPLNDLNAFKNEWMEIEIIVPNSFWSDNLHPDELSTINATNLTTYPWGEKICKSKNVYHRSYLEIDVNQKNERIEWGHVKYHTTMKPGYAFEIVVEWLTPSGPIVWDLINSWMRKANQCNYQLVPIPADPMAQPFVDKSDPLRAPIFIPLLTTFPEEDNSFFKVQEYPEEETKSNNLLLSFQEAILYRFGFLPCVLENDSNKSEQTITMEYHYVHCSGNIFTLIRSLESSNKTITSTIPNSKETTVTSTTDKIGFLWAWNHMIPNKRWKSFVINNSTDNELFQLKLLKDFRNFCSNTDNRLFDFYHHYKQNKTEIPFTLISP